MAPEGRVNGQRHRKLGPGDIQENETKQVQGDGQGEQGHEGRAEAGETWGEVRTDEMYLDVRICCTCWGVSAKVKCASSNRWLEVDAEDKKGQLFPRPSPAWQEVAPLPGG